FSSSISCLVYSTKVEYCGGKTEQNPARLLHGNQTTPRTHSGPMDFQSFARTSFIGAMPRSVTTKVDYPVNAPATRLFGPAVTPTPATLIIADDHPLFRAALREAIGRLLPGTRIIEAGSLASLEEAVQANPSAGLVLLADGYPNKAIATDLGVSEATVKAHVTVVLRKLGTERRTQAALLAQRLLQSDQPGTAIQSDESGEPSE